MASGGGAGADGCFTCRNDADLLAPVHERIHVTAHWRVAHAVGTAMPGWLVVAPRVHAQSLTDLAGDAVVELGPLLHRVSAALQEVTGCVRTYLASFGEAPGFAHLHVHVVPRLQDHPVEWLGPGVFSALARPQSLQLDAAAMDLVSAQLVRALSRLP